MGPSDSTAANPRLNLSPRTMVAVACILSAQVALLGINLWRYSPTFNELGHVPAGLRHWLDGTFELYRVNPPFPRMVATFPLLFSDCRVDFGTPRNDRFSREEIPCGIQFAKINGENTFLYFRIARLAILPFAIVGGIVCFLWAHELWGAAAGLLALCLWSFNPSVLGNGALVMPDTAGAAMGVSAMYLCWKWLSRPSRSARLAAGAALGLAVLSKTTLLLLIPLLPVIVTCQLLTDGRPVTWASIRCAACQLTGVLAVALVVVNLGYGFDGTCEPAGKGRYQSRLFSGGKPPGNHLSCPFSEWIPIPLPRDFLLGIDRQCADFEVGDRSYLRGEWSPRGWWYYHLYGLGVKTPVGSLLLVFAGVCLLSQPHFRAGWTSELCLILPVVAVLLMLSTQTGFSNHTRYSLPATPFAAILGSRCAFRLGAAWGWRAALTVACGVSSVVNGVVSCPHSLSYFNCIAGGGRNGHAHLLDSNVACGQDLLFLRSWKDRHPAATQLHLAHFGWINPRTAGIDFALPPVGPKRRSESQRIGDFLAGPIPGLHAVDVNFLHGTHWPVAAPNGDFVWMETDGFNYEYFRMFAPDDWIGHSIAIYSISLSQANQAREELGLPLLPEEHRIDVPGPPPPGSNRSP